MMKLIVEVSHYLRYIIGTILGTEFNELVWRYRHVYKRGWAENVIDTHPRRQLLIQKISAYEPFTDALEIGCASGSNLYLLARRFPHARFVGIDINPNAIGKGTAFFKKQGIRNVSLFVGKADELERFSDKSFDIVFTDAVLIYIGPDKIKKIAMELKRIARKAIILVELYVEEESGLGNFKEKWWLRNYTKLFQSFDCQINIIKIPPEVWGGNWGMFGYIIEIKRSHVRTARVTEEMPIYVEQIEQVQPSLK